VSCWRRIVDIVFGMPLDPIERNRDSGYFSPGMLRPYARFCRRFWCSRVGPMSNFMAAVRMTGWRRVVNAGRVAPKRWFTSYRKRCVPASNPRTYSSDWSGVAV
jgi:hypothetical protein